MPLDALVDTSRKLRELGAKHEHALVAFSGGKDCRVVLDMAVRSFKRVSAFYMHVVPGLRHDDEILAVARERYGIEVLRYTHWAVFRWLKDGIFNFEPLEYEELAQPTVFDVYDVAQADTGATVVLTGAKRDDSLWRRRFLAANKHRTNVANPIEGWRRADVVAYLARQRIPFIQQESEKSGGIDLATPSLMWLHERYPDDFQKLARTFPFIEAEIWRQRWFFGARPAGRQLHDAGDGAQRAQPR